MMASFYRIANDFTIHHLRISCYYNAKYKTKIETSLIVTLVGRC